MSFINDGDRPWMDLYISITSFLIFWWWIVEELSNFSSSWKESWSSIYTITDDWHPLVGPDKKLNGYFTCFGGSGHSFKLGPPIGEALADIILGIIPKIDIRDLRSNRFEEGESFSSAWGSGNRA